MKALVSAGLRTHIVFFYVGYEKLSGIKNVLASSNQEGAINIYLRLITRKEAKRNPTVN